SSTNRFRLDRLVKTRTGANAFARDQDRNSRRWRRALRHHLDGAPSAGAGYKRLHGFLLFAENKDSHHARRNNRTDRHYDRDWSHTLALQIHLRSSRTKDSRNGNRGVSWNVVVPRFCDRRARIRHWLPCLLLAVDRRPDSLA